MVIPKPNHKISHTSKIDCLELYYSMISWQQHGIRVHITIIFFKTNYVMFASINYYHAKKKKNTWKARTCYMSKNYRTKTINERGQWHQFEYLPFKQKTENKVTRSIRGQRKSAPTNVYFFPFFYSKFNF
jgi:hypothetical protein